MSEMTQKQKTMVTARKASRIVAVLLLFGGAISFLVAIFLNNLQGIMNGIVLFACAAPLFVVSKLIEKKLHV